MRVLDEVGDLVDQRRLALDVHPTAGVVGHAHRDVRDELTPLRTVGEDAGVGHDVGVRLRGLDLDELLGRLAQHAGGATGDERRDRDGHHVVAEQHHEPAQRTRVRELGVAPPHVALRAQRAHGSPGELGDDLHRAASGHLLDQGDVLLPVDLGLDDVVGRPVVASEEPGQRLGGLAVLLVGGGDLGTADRARGVVLGGGDVEDGDRDAARGGLHGDLAVLEGGLGQQSSDRVADLLLRALDVGVGQLLDADLDQQGAHVLDDRRLVDLRRLEGGGGPERELQLLAAGDPQLGDGAGQAAHETERAGTLGGADGAAGVEHVERVAALEHVGVRRDGQLRVDHPLRLGGVGVEQPAVEVGVGVVEVVPAHLVLGLQVHVAVRDGVVVPDLGEVLDALQGHDDALEPVGELDRHGVEGEAAGLLEVRELRDLEAVEPDLPAQPPGAERRGGPVVLDEADVVGAGVDADRREALEIDLLRVLRRRLEDDLELRVRLQPVGVLAVAGVVGSDAGLDVGDVPRLRAENAQGGGRVAGARPDLGVERLGDERTPRGPELLEPQDHLLHRGRTGRGRAGGGGGHGSSLLDGGTVRGYSRGGTSSHQTRDASVSRTRRRRRRGSRRCGPWG